MVGHISASRGGLESGAVRLAGQCLTYRAIGAPFWMGEIYRRTDD